MFSAEVLKKVKPMNWGKSPAKHLEPEFVDMPFWQHWLFLQMQKENFFHFSSMTSSFKVEKLIHWLVVENAEKLDILFQSMNKNKV